MPCLSWCRYKDLWLLSHYFNALKFIFSTFLKLQLFCPAISTFLQLFYKFSIVLILWFDNKGQDYVFKNFVKNLLKSRSAEKVRGWMPESQIHLIVFNFHMINMYFDYLLECVFFEFLSKLCYFLASNLKFLCLTEF